MGLPDQQIAPAGAHGAILGADEWQIARDRIVARDAALGCPRSAVLPTMTGRAPMRMLRARLHLERCDQLRPRSHLATIASEARAPEPLAHGIVGGPELLGPSKCRPRVGLLAELEVAPAQPERGGGVSTGASNARASWAHTVRAGTPARPR
jgi:hypothetical protein